MSINFLNRSQAAKEYLESDYLYQMNYNELLYRLHIYGGHFINTLNSNHLRSQLINKYTDSVMEFTSADVISLNFYFNHLFHRLKKISPTLIPNKKPIGLIKLAENIDWNYPYTINHCIILPIRFINSLKINPNQSEIAQKTSILCHELIHILQRNNRIYSYHNRIFDFIYCKFWGFIKLQKGDIDIQNKYNYNILTNPDGYNYQWAMYLNNASQYLVPILVTDKTHKPVGILVESEKNSIGKYFLTGRWSPIENVAHYMNKFYGMTHQLYHPNEIMAHLISDYIILGKLHSKPENIIEYYKFYKFINKYLIKSDRNYCIIPIK